jgi:hypothetical protein
LRALPALLAAVVASACASEPVFPIGTTQRGPPPRPRPAPVVPEEPAEPAPPPIVVPPQPEVSACGFAPTMTATSFGAANGPDGFNRIDAAGPGSNGRMHVVVVDLVAPSATSYADIPDGRYAFPTLTEDAVVAARVLVGVGEEGSALDCVVEARGGTIEVESGDGRDYRVTAELADDVTVTAALTFFGME